MSSILGEIATITTKKDYIDMVRIGIYIALLLERKHVSAKAHFQENLFSFLGERQR